jgi:voltage-gated hydrogen channel 1
MSSFFKSWFHIFDASVVLVSFLLDVLAHGLAEEIGSLVIVLRLWRFVKIVEEMSVGASERMEDIEGRMGVLEKQNSELKERLQAMKQKRNGGQSDTTANDGADDG